MDDPYLWMEDLENPKVLEWALREDERARRALKEVAAKLKPRIEKLYFVPYLIKVIATEHGYLTLVREGRSYKIKLVADGDARILVDSRELGRNAVVRNMYASRDGRWAAYTISFAGADEGLLRVVDLEAGEVVDELTGTLGDVVWLGDGKYYYTRLYRSSKTPDGVDPPAERVFLREAGKEEMVFGEGLPSSHFISLKPSSGCKQALLTISYGWASSTVYAGRIDEPGEWRMIYGGDYLAYPVDYVDGEYLVVSFEGEGMGRVVGVHDGKVRLVVGEGEHPIRSAAFFNRKLVLNYLVNAASRLRFFNLSGELVREVAFDIPGTVNSLSSSGNALLFKYESFLIPYRLYRVRENRLELLESSELELKWSYEVEDEWVTLGDGTRVHMFLVHRKGVVLEKILIYGYGGFGVAITPSFHPYAVPLLEDGGVFAVANVRGGSEHGEKWHKEGMREKKQNVFKDFIACIESLKAAGARVVAAGISNGGLLVGAVLTQRPALLDGAVIGYPVLDMLRFHKLYVGKAWVPEYGNPDDPKDAKYLAEYSPYHNVRRTRYPPVLIYTGLHDDRVHPAHAFKFAARLKEAGAPVLLRVEKASGHSGASPEVKIHELSDILAFIYKVLGLNASGSST